jgi:hypothetical protein
MRYLPPFGRTLALIHLIQQITAGSRPRKVRVTDGLPRQSAPVVPTAASRSGVEPVDMIWIVIMLAVRETG